MYDTLRPLLDADDDAKETPLSRKRKNVGSFLSSWQHVVEDEPHAESHENGKEEDDEEALEGGNRYTRFKRYYRRMFKENVEKPEHFEADDTEQEETHHDRLPSGFLLPDIKLPNEPLDAEAESQSAESQEAEEFHVERPTFNRDSPRAAEHEPDETLEHHEPEPETPEMEVDDHAESAVPLPGEAEPPEPPLPPERERSADLPPPEPPESEAGTFRAPEAEPEQKKPERAVLPHKHSNMPAWLAFLGGEFLSRRRDRKLRERQDEFAKHQEVLKAEQEKARARQLEAEKKQRTDSERLDKVEQHTEQPKIERVEHVEPTRIEAPAHIEAPEPVIASELNPERHKELTAHNSQEIMPQKVLEQVEVAADKNIPIETLYERRHEIKDEDRFRTQQASYLPHQAAPEPVANILHRPEFDRAQQIAEWQKMSHPAPNRAEYTQAIKIGLIAAAGVIGIVVIALLLR